MNDWTSSFQPLDLTSSAMVSRRLTHSGSTGRSNFCASVSARSTVSQPITLEYTW
ncbi:Uncharacterised protein [Mycobacteroides abscessus subsp. abscessus]|nr:Uncharacterised protein [Mycobacteroides abscessus subsp. abscessus]